MKKLVFLCSELSGTGGTETVLIKVLNHLIKKYEIELVLTNVPGKKEWIKKIDRHVNIRYFNQSGKLKKFAYILRVFFENKDAMYISLSPKLISMGYKVRKLFKFKYKIISWIHFSLDEQGLYFNPKTTIPYADGHLAISKTIVEQLKEFNISSHKIRLIYNPIEKNDIFDKKKTEKINLVYAGRIMLRGQKNLKELLDLAKFNPKVYLDIFGTGEEIEKCQKYAEKLNVSDRVVWHGWTDNVWDSLKFNPSAIILTSKYEGLPMILLESISRGIPVITSKFKGSEDIIIDDLNGFTYNQGNINELNDVINKLNAKIWDKRKIQGSINFLYPDQYFERLEQDIEYFNNNLL